MALAGRKFRVILIGMVAALLVAGGLAASASAQVGNDRDCADFSSQQEAQQFFEANGGPQEDPHRLDADNDGEACETFSYDDDTDNNATSAQYNQYQQQQQVINIPNKPLPNTGGFPPLLVVGFFLVAGAGLGTALLRRRF